MSEPAEDNCCGCVADCFVWSCFGSVTRMFIGHPGFTTPSYFKVKKLTKHEWRTKRWDDYPDYRDGYDYDRQSSVIVTVVPETGQVSLSGYTFSETLGENVPPTTNPLLYALSLGIVGQSNTVAVLNEDYSGRPWPGDASVSSGVAFRVELSEEFTPAEAHIAFQALRTEAIRQKGEVTSASGWVALVGYYGSAAIRYGWASYDLIQMESDLAGTSASPVTSDADLLDRLSHCTVGVTPLIQNAPAGRSEGGVVAEFSDDVQWAGYNMSPHIMWLRGWETEVASIPCKGCLLEERWSPGPGYNGETGKVKDVHVCSLVPTNPLPVHFRLFDPNLPWGTLWRKTLALRAVQTGTGSSCQCTQVWPPP